MKHLLSSITVLFILLTSTVSWGSVDGKGVFCDSYQQIPSYYFLFKNGRVEQYWIVQFDDYFKRHKNHPNDTRKWSSTTDEIFWTIGEMEYRLDREKLMLRKYRIDKNRNQKFEQHNSVKCEVLSSTDDFFILLHSKIEKLQNELDKGKKSNKI